MDSRATWAIIGPAIGLSTRGVVRLSVTDFTPRGHRPRACCRSASKRSSARAARGPRPAASAFRVGVPASATSTIFVAVLQLDARDGPWRSKRTSCTVSKTAEMMSDRRTRIATLSQPGRCSSMDDETTSSCRVSGGSRSRREHDILEPGAGHEHRSAPVMHARARHFHVAVRTGGAQLLDGILAALDGRAARECVAALRGDARFRRRDVSLPPGCGRWSRVPRARHRRQQRHRRREDARLPVHTR